MKRGISIRISVDDHLTEALRHEVVDLLADQSISILELAERLRVIYRREGCPFGDTDEGLAEWLSVTEL
jgi:hypothetical protein